MQHLDEGTIHAWLDGALSPEEAATVEAHASECAECAALVAEARGLIAASTRILNSLDDVPSGVIPSTTADVPTVPQLVKQRRWYDRTDFRAAAAILFVAGASIVIAKSQRNPTPSFKTAVTTDRVAALSAPAESNAVSAPTVVDKIEPNKQTERPEADAMTRTVSPSGTARRVAAAPSVVGALKVRSGNEAAREDRFAPPSAANLTAPSAVAQAAPAPPPAPKPMEKAMESAAGARVGALMDIAANRSIQGKVEGRITTPQGAGIGGANVIVQGTTLGTSTDSSGKFKIENVPAGEHRLIVRRIGYDARTIPISVNDSMTTANAALNATAASLGEVVVTSTTTAGAPALRQLRADTTGSTRRVVYEVSPGVQVTLVETPDPAHMKSAVARDEMQADAKKDTGKIASAPAAPPPPAPSLNTISWTDGGRRYTLSGPLSTKQLEEIKSRLMKMRR